MYTKDSTPSRIIEFVDALKSGSTFICGDLSHCGDNSSIRSALVRLCAKGDIKRICHGVYLKPDTPYVGMDYCDIAKEIARKKGSSVQFKEERFVNNTHIVTFYTDASTRSTILDDGTIIKFIHRNKLN